MTQVTLDQALEMALQHHGAGRLAEAESIYRQILVHQPNHPEVLHLLGVLTGQTGSPDTAVELIRKAIALCPTQPNYHSNLGKFLKDLGRIDEAGQSCRRAIELKPDMAEAYNNLGYALGDNRETVDEAIAACHEALRIRPEYAEAYNNLAIALRRKGLRDEAARAFRQALRIKPDYAVAHHNLGDILRVQGHFAEAVACDRRALALAPLLVEAYVSLSSTLLQLGQTGEAVAVCQQAQARGIDSPVIRYLLAGCTGASRVSTAPTSYVMGLFEDYAETFDQHLVQDLHYHVPERVHDAVLRAARKSGDALTPPIFDGILDLGCGTGLCGRLFRPHARVLHGVDLSPAMIEKARQGRMYDELILGDIVTELAARPNTYDLILATDVFIYVGDLDQVFAGAETALQPGGFFAFSVEHHEPDGYVLRPSLRFAHSTSYLRKLAATYHFSEVSLEPSPIRLDGSKEIPGWIMVLRKSQSVTNKTPG